MSSGEWRVVEMGTTTQHYLGTVLLEIVIVRKSPLPSVFQEKLTPQTTVTLVVIPR